MTLKRAAEASSEAAAPKRGAEVSSEAVAQKRSVAASAAEIGHELLTGSSDAARCNDIVLKHSKAKEATWFETMNAELESEGMLPIKYRSQCSKIQSTAEEKAQCKKHRIYSLKYGTEHMLTVYASAAARFRMRLTLARRSPENASALLSSPEHMKDAQVQFPGTDTTVEHAMSHLYVAEVCVCSSPFITVATEYLEKVYSRLDGLQGATQRQKDFRLYLECYALFFFGSKKYMAACSSHVENHGVQLLWDSDAWINYVTSHVKQSMNPFHAIYQNNQKRHYMTRRPFKKQLDALVAGNEEDSDSDEEECAAVAAAPLEPKSVQLFRALAFVEDMLSFSNLKATFDVVTSKKTCEAKIKLLMAFPSFGGTGFVCKNFINLLAYATHLWPSYDFTPSGPGPRNYCALRCGYPRRNERFQDVKLMSHFSMYIHLQQEQRSRLQRQQWGIVALGKLAWSLMTAAERESGLL